MILTDVMASAAKLSSTQIESVDWRGHLGVESVLFLKPSGAAGTSSFQIPQAGLEVVVNFSAKVRADFELTFQSPIVAGNELNVQRASLQSDFGDGSLAQFRAGLFEPEWLRGGERFWPWDRYSRDFGWAFERWGYTSAADYGFEIFQRADRGGFGVAVVNGEGLRQTDTGPQKDFHVWGALDWRSESRATELLFYAIRGGYENVPSIDSAKERYSLNLRSAADEGWLGGIESLFMRDPVDSINLKVVDLADLTDRGGERVSGRIGSLVLGYRFAKIGESQWQLFARRDQVDPIVDQAGRGVTAVQTGFFYSPRAGVDWLFFVSDLDYGERHSNAVRDENTWRLSYHVRWD